MNKTMGEYATFWFYMCWCVVGMFFVYFFLPETKGKSLEEIERMFANKKKQQLWASNGATNTTLCALDIGKTDSIIFTVEPIPRVSAGEKRATDDGVFNHAYDSDDSECDDDGIVCTPL